MSEILVRHREASGSLSAGCWEFDPARGVVVLVLRTDPSALILAVDIPVCSSQTARHGAFHLRRVSEDAWRVMPAQYLAGPDGHLTVSPAACATVLGVTPILLTHSPPNVSTEMARA